jgi:hypothetical protein
MTAEISLCLDISFIDAAPGSPEKQVCDVPGIQSLPLGDFGSCLVLL